MGKNNLASLITCLVLLTSISLIAATGVWLLVQTDDSCLGKSGMGVYFAIFGFSLIVIVCCSVCCYRNERVMMAGGCSAMGMVLLVTFFGIIALTRSTTRFASLQKETNSTKSWMDIKSCLYNYKKVCAHFQHKYENDTAQKFFVRHLTCVQSGCCKPPMECNFNFSSPTVWIEPENGTYSNSDCSIWNNDPKKLCYNCQACKLGFARDLKKPWTIAGSVVLVASLMLISAVIIAVVLGGME